MSFNQISVHKSTPLEVVEGDDYQLALSHDPEEVSLLSSGFPLYQEYSKVQLKADDRSFHDLSAVFLDVSVEVLQKIWESNNQSWDACFDVLKAWQASHGPVLISMTQLEFELDTEDWPSLPKLLRSSLLQSIPQLTSRMTRLTVAVSDNDSISGISEGWSFCDDLSRDDNDTHSDVGDSWVRVDSDEKVSASKSTSSTEKKRSRPSFKDVLLTPSSTTTDNDKKRTRCESNISGDGQVKIWRPTVVCFHVPHQHCNIVYMNSTGMKSKIHCNIVIIRPRHNYLNKSSSYLILFIYIIGH